jgi:hypothetical protein
MGRDLNSDNLINEGETDSVAKINVNWEMELMSNNNYVQRSNAFGTAAGKWIRYDNKLMTMTNIDTTAFQVTEAATRKLTLLRHEEQAYSTWYVFSR